MKRLLIVGDSLAGGLPHLSFPAILKQSLRGWEVKASGVGGDTLAGMRGRLFRLLHEVEPDVLVIEAGSNDVLLPLLKARGGFWKLLVERLESRGSVATDGVGPFAELYARTIEEARRHAGEVIVATIACMGEDTRSRPNLAASAYNQAIRGAAAEGGARLAAVDTSFREILARVETPGRYLLDEPSGLFLDTLRCLTRAGAYRLSGRRGLALTIDGVHLNPYGASVYAQTMYPLL